MKLLVQIERKPDGAYVAVCPSLPGCYVHGTSRSDAASRIQRRIDAYLASLDVPRRTDVQLLLRT